MGEYTNFMGYQWAMANDGLITIGISEEGVEELTEIVSIHLPSEGDRVAPDEVCGDIETDQGPMNIYCPVEGEVIEVNEAVLQNPSLIQGDCLGDGWLLKIEPDNMDEFDAVDLNNDED